MKLPKLEGYQIVCILLVMFCFTMAIIIGCHEHESDVEEDKTECKSKSTQGFIYKRDVINGHTYFYDNTGMMTDHDCEKCRQDLIHIIDSVLDDRVIKFLSEEK